MPIGRADELGAHSSKILITGTGRSGTTLLVQLLDSLGLDTGLSSGKLSPFVKDSNAGLEYWTADYADAPRVIKDTTLPVRLRALLEDQAVTIEHVIIPIRDLDVATASRLRASDFGRITAAVGGLWGTVRPSHQRAALAFLFYDLLLTLADFEIPFTLLSFPRFATDPEYCFRLLAWLVPEMPEADFRRVFADVVREDLIHQQVLSGSERNRTRYRSLRVAVSRNLRKFPDYWEQ